MPPENPELPDFPATERMSFMVLETSDQRDSLYHPTRRVILSALGTGHMSFISETSRSEKTLDDGSLVTEEITIKRPTIRYWLNVQEILGNIEESNPELKVSVFNCHYHLRKLLEQELVEQYPPPREDKKGTSKRVRGRYFRARARFFVPTTFEISPELAERDIIPDEVNQKAVALAERVKESGVADAFEYSLKIGKKTYWFSVTMSLHDDGESIQSIVRDITSQRNAQESLRISQEKLNLALRGANLAPWDWHHRLKQIEFSPQYAEMLGYTLDKLKSAAKKWEDLIHPDDLDRVSDTWNDHVDGKTPFYSAEYRLKHKNGQYIWVLDRGQVVERDDNGNPLRAAGTILDITSEKLVMEALDRSEQRYRRLVDESLQGIAIFSEGRIVFANPAFAEIVGRSVGELLAMSPKDTWSMVHPDEIAELEERNRLVDAGVTVLPRHRFRYIRPNGEIRWVDSYVNIIEHDGKVALQSLEVDITEQREMEEALRESENWFRGLFEASPIGILLFNSEGKVMQLNQAAMDILGVRQPSDYESYRLQKDPNLPDWVLKDIEEGIVISFEAEYDIMKSGFITTKLEPIYLQVSGSALQVKEDSKVAAFLAYIQDFTERHASEVALRESEKKFRTLVESNSQPAVIVQGSPLQIVYANPAVTESAGYTTDELARMGPNWITDVVHPRSLQGSIETLTDILEGRLETPSRGYEDEYMHKDGSIVWYRSYPSRIIYEGKSAVQILLLDITKLKALEDALSRSDEEYKSLFMSSEHAIILLRDTEIVDSNKPASRMFSCKRKDLQNMHIWQLSPRNQSDGISSKQKSMVILDS
ncbi:MAG: PAS domain S-box protein, partial [Candidatus Thorarchaeota archaeon]